MPSDQPVTVATAAQILRKPKVWLTPTILLSLLSFTLSLVYMGGILNPSGDLHRLPIGLVNSDQGATVAGQQVNMGDKVTAGVAAAPDPQRRVSWRTLSKEEAEQKLGSNILYAVLEVPADFSSSVAALGVSTAGSSPPRPTITVLTNPGAGTLASSMASNIAQTAIHGAATQLGPLLLQQQELARQQAQRAWEQGEQAREETLKNLESACIHNSQAVQSGRRGPTPQACPSLPAGPAAPPPAPTNAEQLQLSNPIAVNVTPFHPVGSHSGLGLSAFYYTLLLVLFGFLGGNVINKSVDSALGYTATEFGPWRKEAPLVQISRTHTWLITSTISVVLSLLTSSLALLACTVILRMDTPHPGMLWVYSVCATATVGLGTQAVNAAFGGIGQLINMFIFISLALPSSGTTIPLQALPAFYKGLSYVEPLRQLADGVRAILYFDARADAGLIRAWSMMGAGAVAALIFGFAMTRYYDRKGLHRIAPEHPHT